MTSKQEADCKGAVSSLDSSHGEGNTYPHHDRSDRLRGQPAGTRITVRTVVIATLLRGQTPEQLLQHYPHLSLAAIHAARSYYYDHREAMDREIAEHEAIVPTK